MPRRPLLAAVLLLAVASSRAHASSAKDLTGSWLGRVGCEDGAFRLSLRVVELTGHSALVYTLSGMAGTAGRLTGLGTLAPDGRLSLSRPLPNPLLPEQLPALLVFSPQASAFTGRTDLGALESAAGATAKCALEEKGARLSCAVEWRLLQQGSRCALRLLKGGAKDKGALPCPAGLRGKTRDGVLRCV